MPEISQIVYQVLRQLGSDREARYYFELFNRTDSSRFALIVVDHRLLDQSIDELGPAISLLYHLGLLPVIYHGNAAKHDVLMAGLQQHGVDTASVEPGAENTTPFIDLVAQAIRSGHVPVCHHKASGPASFMPGIFQLSRQIKPNKIIILSHLEGMTDVQGRVISTINLNASLGSLNASLSDASKALLPLEQAQNLLMQMPRETSISITSMHNLVKELFTYQGAGTLVRLEEKVTVFRQFDDELRNRLTELVKSSFKRHLSDQYFTQLNLDKGFISESATAMAVVLKNSNDIPYLDKFVVTRQAQGAGLGKVLWTHLVGEYSQMYWRARVNNRVNSWYLRQADCSHREGDWIVFGINISPDDWQDCIADALSRVVYMVD